MASKKHTGGRHSEERKMDVAYATAASPLGRLLVAGTNRGISAIYLGDSDAALESALHREYPTARIHHDSPSVDRWIQQVLTHLSGGKTQLQLPLDLRATEFQWRVWKELQKIPYGSQRTYSDISRRIGCPKGSRAVGSACARNPVSILIPCHRVVREDGGLGGYRWGIERKVLLLRQENGAKELKS
jgi:AraC family transcriptional regulator, regulatory protein of adaptative response / methylated-DNA-[protein]-cysteine methyltransferase